MSFLFYITLAVLLLLLIFPLVDAWMNFQVWQKRIHIGRHKQLSEWRVLIASTCYSWLKKPPTVPLTDQHRLRLWDMLTGQYRVSTIQDWQDAGLLLGLLHTGTMKQHSAVQAYITKKIDRKTGAWKQAPQHVDSALLAYSLMQQSETTAQELKAAYKEIYDLIIRIKGKQNTVPYRSSLPTIRFVDTLGFICPFLFKYSCIFDQPEALTLAERQLIEYDQALLNHQFPAHAYNLTYKQPCGVHDWGRGLGWYVLALTECYQIIQEYKLNDNLNIRERIIQLSDSILPFQLNDGGYADMFFNTSKTAESSATVLCGLLLNKCYEITGEKRYRQATESCLKQLMKHTQRSGKIDLCQGDTKGIGFYSHSFGYMPFVQGLALKLANEFNKNCENP